MVQTKCVFENTASKIRQVKVKVGKCTKNAGEWMRLSGKPVDCVMFARQNAHLLKVNSAFIWLPCLVTELSNPDLMRYEWDFLFAYL